MKPGGVVRVATDVDGYPSEVRAHTANDSPVWREVACDFCESAFVGHGRPSTHYARKAELEGRDVHDLCFLLDHLGGDV